MELKINNNYNPKSFGVKNIILLIVCIAIPLAVGALAGYLTKNNMDVFRTINKPAFTPPATVFPIVWAVIYVMMGVGLYLVLNSCGSKFEVIYVAYPFLIQLLLNFFWSLIFFNMRAYTLAFICLVLLWGMILRTIFFWEKCNEISSYLMIVYLIWVSFAGYLNLGIIFLNQSS